MKGVGVAGDKAAQERQREIGEDDGGRTGGTEIDKWRVGCISYWGREQRKKKKNEERWTRQTSASLPSGATVRSGSVERNLLHQSVSLLSLTHRELLPFLSVLALPYPRLAAFQGRGGAADLYLHFKPSWIKLRQIMHSGRVEHMQM